MKMIVRNSRVWPAAVSTAALVFGSLSLAQEDPKGKAKAEPVKKVETKVEAEKKAEPEKKPAEKKEEPKAEFDAATLKAAAEFPKTFEKWKNVLGELRALQLQYSVAKTDEEKKKVEGEFNAKIKEGEKLEPEVTTGAEAVYKVEPRQNRDAERFLASMAQSAYDRDAYEDAARLSLLLAENGYKNPTIYKIAAVSSFEIADYEKAKEYFKLAEERGALDEEARREKDQVEDYIGYWRVEDEARLKDAQANDLPRVLISTNKGDIELELFENEAPNTVANFISLVNKKFYDGVVFHRVLPHFMAQGGDPKGTGTGGPGYTIPCETDAKNARKHFRGTLSMAHAGKDTGGSQFFLTFKPTGFLDGRHTAFGRVVKGIDVLSKLQRIDPSDPKPGIVPDKIVTAKVLRKRDHAYEVKNKKEDPTSLPPKKDETKKEEKKDPAKKDEGAKKEEPAKKDEVKKEEAPKKDEPAKKVEEKKEEVKKVEEKKVEEKKVEEKKVEEKKDAPK